MIISPFDDITTVVGTLSTGFSFILTVVVPFNVMSVLSFTGDPVILKLDIAII